MRKTLLIDFKRELGKSKGRFIAIFMLMFISSFTLMGLKQTGPDIRQTADDYLFNYNLADITLTSTLGFDSDEINTLATLDGVSDLEFDYFSDVKIDNSIESVRIFSETDNISLYEVVDGRLPAKSGEIALSNQLSSSYNIGDTFTIDQSSNETKLLTTNNFEIVGFVNSTEIISKVSMGLSTAGSGNLNGYAVTTDDDFDSEVYTIARITYDDLVNVDPFLSEYERKLELHKQVIEEQIVDLPTKRLNSITTVANKEISDGYAEIDDALEKLDKGKAELDQGKLELDAAKELIDESNALVEDGQVKIDQGYANIKSQQETIDSKQKQINKGMDTYLSNKKKLDANQSLLTSGQSELDSSKQKLEDNKQQLESGKSQYQQQISALQTQLDAIDEQLLNPDLTPEEIDQLNASKTELEANLSAVENTYQDFLNNTYEPGLNQIEASEAILEEKQAELTAAQMQLDAGYVALNKGYDTLVTGQKQLDQGQIKLNNGKKLLDEKQATLKSKKKLLEESYQTYLTGLDTYYSGLDTYNQEKLSALEEISEAQSDLADAEEEVEELKAPVYRIDTRVEALGSEGYQIYSSLATSIDSIANIFPIIMYLVAALVTFTTMSRFVEEERTNSGTLFSLGYSQSTIMKKFIYYGLIASVLGSILGTILGNFILPLIIYNAFSINFTFPSMSYTFDFSIAFVSIIISILVAIVPAFLVVNKEFKSSPAALLLPKPPVNGAKILLERVSIIWNKLKFAHKVTARNIFRYKKRMLMTIFGVCGSVALLFTGLGMQSSIAGITDLQFENIMKYDMIVSIDENSSEQTLQQITNLAQSDEIAGYMPTYVDQITMESPSNERQDVTLISPTDYQHFSDYLLLRDRKTHEPLELDESGVVISEQLSSVLKLDVGDQLEYKDSEDQSHQVNVSGITEMYMGHFMIISSDLYQEIYGHSLTNNGLMVKVKDNSEENINLIASEFMDLDGVEAVSQNTILIDQVEVIVQSLNSVMFALVVIAVALAIVILYNLTNINVSERMRELSTTKVLGYYDKEVTMYIYRETIILTLIGIVTGFGLGRIIQLFMIKTVAPSYLMFDPTVPLHVFLIPTITTTLVTIGLGIIINNRLKKVDMLDALKSVD